MSVDPNRVFPVNQLVLHHSVTPKWSEKSKAELAQWFSDNGYAQAYGSNPANWSGLINPYTGGRSYSQAHFAQQQVTSATPDATDAERAKGYRLVPLIDDPWNNVTWHAANWPVNQQSIGIEHLGDFRNYTLEEAGQEVDADFWRAQDRALGGQTTIWLHEEVSQQGTQCPARIAEVRDHIVDLVNSNPAPTPPPVTTPTQPAAPDASQIAYETITPKQVKLNKDTNLWDFNFTDYTKAQAVKAYPAGTVIDVVAIATNTLGSKYYMTAYSYNDGDIKATNGFNVADADDYTPPAAPTEPTTPAQPEQPTTPSEPMQPDDGTGSDAGTTTPETGTDTPSDGTTAPENGTTDGESGTPEPADDDKNAVVAFLLGLLAKVSPLFTSIKNLISNIFKDKKTMATAVDPIVTETKKDITLLTSGNPLKSRKFWLAIVAALVVFGNNFFGWGLTDDQVWTFLTPILAFIGVEGAADLKSR